MDSFLAMLQNKPLLGDGAMGTLLFDRGVPMGICLEALVVERPAVIKAIHADYARAGADIITTHTFGANRMRLAQHGLEEKVAALNRAAVEHVKQVRVETQGVFWIAGNVGPSGSRTAWQDAVQREELAAIFGEQIAALADAGADLLLFETFSEVEELVLAVQCARALCSLPIVASMSYGADALTLAGQDASTVTKQLITAGADVIAANCSIGPQQMVQTLAEMYAAAAQGVYAVSPNAGLPEQGENGKFYYPVDPAAFAAYVPRYLAQGARIIGGCCGTTPAHVAAMRAQLNQSQVG